MKLSATVCSMMMLVLLLAGCGAPPRDVEEKPARTISRAEEAARLRAIEAEQRSAQRAAREGFAPESGRPVVIKFSEQEMAAIRDREERALRAREAQERIDWGRVLTDAERQEVELYGKLLTDEERAVKAEELAKAEEEARLQAEEEAKAAADAAAVEAAARQSATDEEAAALQTKRDRLRSLGGDQYRIERTKLLQEGIVDDSTDYRAPAWSDEQGALDKKSDS